MYETARGHATLLVPDGSSLDAQALAGWAAGLSELDRDCPDAERIDRIRALEELKAAASAAQAKAGADFAASQLAEQEAARVPTSERGRGIASQIGLARRESPVRGAQLLGLAKVLDTEMPHTMAALAGGRINEWRATLLARETACLSREDRAEVDRRLCADPATLDSMGDAAILREAKRLAYALDPEAVVERIRKAEADRNVTCRPAPDTMAYLTGLLPVAQGVACHAALLAAVTAAKAEGDSRARGQIMADTMVERLTGQADADGVDVEVQLVITDTALFGDPAGDPADTPPPAAEDDHASSQAAGDDRFLHASAADDMSRPERTDGGVEEPALLYGYGPIPADLARALVRRAIADPTVTSWLRRLYLDPHTGALVAMDSRARSFPAGLAGFIRTRDQICRTPYCNASIRQIDHVVPHTADGATSEPNGQGLCQACNLAKQGLGWRSRPGATADRRHTVHVTTPTGHRYRSQAPPLPGTARAVPPRADLYYWPADSPLERALADLVLAS